MPSGWTARGGTDYISAPTLVGERTRMFRITTLFAGGALALSLFGVAAAGTLEDGYSAYQRGDYMAALHLWRSLADQGDATAQGALGRMYDEGRGVPQDYVQALVWYRRSAEQGFAPAQDALGLMYYFGHGVPQDYAAAVVWLRQAADQQWAAGQLGLGFMYANGVGVPQDYVLAHMWFNLVATAIGPSAEQQSDAIKRRDDVAAKMTPDQIAEAQKMAREWKPVRKSN